MYNYLYKYLALYKHLTIPGIGTFMVEAAGAKLDFAEKLIHPALPLIMYNMDNTTPERKLFNFLSSHLQVDEVNAIRKYNDFAASLKEELHQNGAIVLPGIGKLIRQVYNTFSFVPEQHVDSFFSAIPAERVIRKNAEHFVRVGEEEKTSTEMQEQLNIEEIYIEEVQQERWWMSAVILAAIGIAAIVLHFYSRR